MTPCYWVLAKRSPSSFSIRWAEMYWGRPIIHAMCALGNFDDIFNAVLIIFGSGSLEILSPP